MTRTWLRSLLLLPLLAAPLVAADDEKGFVPLFDGKSLDGWTKVGGGATYHTEDGMIVGEVGPGANTFLRTNKLYHNFILKLDVKLDVPGNSGIQFRSHESDKGRVFGYQCEIDPSPRAWTAGLYDEGRRGWLYPLAGHPEAQKAFKLADWNHFVIEACGPHLRTWLNGVPCADLIDTADLEGFIALQVHAGKAGRIRWKDIQLKDLGKSAWSPLWDFAVRLKFKSIKGNSGLYFRVEEGGGAGVKGFQAEIDPANDVGGLYETDGRAWVVKPKPEDVKSWLKPGEWNELSVVAWGKRIVVHVNGRKTAELTDDPGRPQGRISLQLHGGQDMDVWFKDIEILDLKGACRDPGEASR